MRSMKLSPILMACVLVGLIAVCAKSGSPEIKSANSSSGEVKSDEAVAALDPEARTKQLNELADKLMVDFKNDPLRVAYETEVTELQSSYGNSLTDRNSSTKNAQE
jgi:hypothetical protein